MISLATSSPCVKKKPSMYIIFKFSSGKLHFSKSNKVKTPAAPKLAIKLRDESRESDKAMPVGSSGWTAYLKVIDDS